MTVMAVGRLRNLVGGSQPQLMIGDDGNGWVVKFMNNPQHPFILANEMLVTNLAKTLGLPVPDCTVIDVSPRLVLDTPELRMGKGRGRYERCSAGRQFGSRLIGGAFGNLALPYLHDRALHRIRNVEAFLGMLCLDKWTGNCDGRQAVFKLHRSSQEYTVYFIDHGFCFSASEWSFLDTPLRGVYRENCVYSHVSGWKDFEPWLGLIESLTFEAIWAAAVDIPPEWYKGEVLRLERLVHQLFDRRTKVRGLIEDFRDSNREPFPLWTGRAAGEKRAYSFL
jgi:hypothetical protein